MNLEDFLYLGEIYNAMKNISILLVMCLLGTLCMNAQKTTVPVFKTVQVRPGVIKVPGFSLRAGTATRPDLKSITSSELKGCY